MEYNSDLAKHLQQKYNLPERLISLWKTRKGIPNKYKDLDYDPKKSVVRRLEQAKNKTPFSEDVARKVVEQHNLPVRNLIKWRCLGYIPNKHIPNNLGPEMISIDNSIIYLSKRLSIFLDLMPDDGVLFEEVGDDIILRKSSFSDFKVHLRRYNYAIYSRCLSDYLLNKFDLSSNDNILLKNGKIKRGRKDKKSLQYSTGRSREGFITITRNDGITLSTQLCRLLSLEDMDYVAFDQNGNNIKLTLATNEQIANDEAFLIKKISRTTATMMISCMPLARYLRQIFNGEKNITYKLMLKNIEKESETPIAVFDSAVPVKSNRL